MKLLNKNNALCLAALLCSSALFGMQQVPAMQSTSPIQRPSAFVTHTTTQAPALSSADLWSQGAATIHLANGSFVPALSLNAPLTTPQRATLYALFRAEQYNCNGAISPWLNSPIISILVAPLTPSPMTPIAANNPYAVARAKHYQQAAAAAQVLPQHIPVIQATTPRPNRYLPTPASKPTVHPIFALTAPAAKQPVQLEAYVPLESTGTTTELAPSISFDLNSTNGAPRRVLFKPHIFDPKTQAIRGDVSVDEDVFWDQSIATMEHQVGIPKK
jgi:hypothetical protein